MTIPTYSFADVLNFLESNPKRVFGYCNPRCDDDESCLMGSFFASKGFGEGFSANLDGTKCVKRSASNEEIFAVISDMPESGNYIGFIQAIHDNPEDCRSRASGYQILANIHNFKFPE